jgi:uncharacterized membrane protein YbhN (UPF0104 family)
VTGLFLVILVLGIMAHRLPGADRIAAIVDRWPRVREVARSLQGGLQVAARPRTLVEALLASAAAWSCSILGLAALGQALGLQLSMGQAALITSGVALASAIPAGPSNIGTFEIAAATVGDAIGVPRESALALGLLSHAMIFAVTSIGGLIAFARIGWRASDGATEPPREPAAPASSGS